MPKNTDIEKKQEDEGADEDIVVDESSPDFQSLLKKLKHDLKECHSERTEYLAGWQRAKADYINQKSEFEKQKQEIVRYAKEDLFHEMFDLADSFEMAFANKEAWESVPANWRIGVEYIYNQLEAIFQRNGLDSIFPLGQLFDPARHHSIGTIEVENEKEDNLVLEVIKKGYSLNGKVLRPAQVKVGKLK